MKGQLVNKKIIIVAFLLLLIFFISNQSNKKKLRKVTDLSDVPCYDSLFVDFENLEKYRFEEIYFQEIENTVYIKIHGTKNIFNYMKTKFSNNNTSIKVDMKKRSDRLGIEYDSEFTPSHGIVEIFEEKPNFRSNRSKSTFYYKPATSESRQSGTIYIHWRK